jgi:gluconolactonase
MIKTLEDVQVIASGLDHPECVNFGPDGRAYAGGEAGQMFQFTMDGQVRRIAEVGGSIGGLCLDGNGNIYECNYGHSRVNRVTATGKVSVYSQGTPDRQAAMPNYPVFDSEGNLYYSDSGDYYEPTGRLFVVRPDGNTECLYGDNLHFPNGLAIDAGEKWLYVIQSTGPNILRFPLGRKRFGEPEVYVQLPQMVPDGIAFAESGNLYLACYVPDALYRITPDRQLELLIKDPGADKLSRPTNVAFEPDGTRLCFANLGGMSVNAIDVGERGAPLRYPKLP